MKFEISILATSQDVAPVISGVVPTPDPSSSTRLNVAFVCDCVRKAAGIVENVSVYCVDDIDMVKAAVEERVSVPQRIRWHHQAGAHLGTLIEQSTGPCLVLAANAPSVPVDYLVQAAERVLVDDVVIGPSIDGGVYLIGHRQPASALFHAQPWGTSELFPGIRDRAQHLKLAARFLSPWYCVSTPDELRRLSLELETLPVGSADDCPFTRAVLADLGLLGAARRPQDGTAREV